jgi:hypothetical protein
LPLFSFSNSAWPPGIGEGRGGVHPRFQVDLGGLCRNGEWYEECTSATCCEQTAADPASIGEHVIPS